MYVKVHKKDNQWFRVNGTLVGDAVSPGNILEELKAIYGTEKEFATNSKSIIIIHHGYFDGSNNFNHFCHNASCSECHPIIRERFCYRRSKAHKSAGYYINLNSKPEED